MPDSDDEYIEADSGDEVSHRKGTRRSAVSTRSRTKSAAPSKEKWEEIHRSWDQVVEGADGSIASSVINLLESTKRKRVLRDATPLQRGIIRHMILVLDLSMAMTEKDFRPTRYLVTLSYAVEFIREFFEQNPISQLGIVGMRDGVAERVSEMSGNPVEHISAVQRLRQGEPKGNPSLQNALDMSRAALFHTPSHGTREALIIFAALSSSDPSDIHETISSLVEDKITCRVVGLAAQVAICTELCRKTNPGDTTAYGIAMHEFHFRELLMEATIPPVTRKAKSSVPSLLMMGFPSREVEQQASFCACHGKPTKGGYRCSRCTSKVCALPSECPTCGLTLILSTHLARSYHHLFPLENWVEVPWKRAGKSTHCFGCQSPFPPVPDTNATKSSTAIAAIATASGTPSSNSVSSRYACGRCRKHFCVDCDVFAHEVLHNCPGCLSMGAGVGGAVREEGGGGGKKVKAKGAGKAKGKVSDANGNGSGSGSGAVDEENVMVID
ncbi:putative RNA polymerase TFIIH complex subunit Ssl1 [Tirmania nivea]|nr:putative RNA polymerase TFIIH complex subunit Ssl1 [Tirmania nivea]